MRTPETRRPAYVYVIQAGHRGPIKIGKAYSVEERIKSLQTGNAAPILLCYSIEQWNALSAKEAETGIHQDLKRFRLKGEWFQASADVWRYFLGFHQFDFVKVHREIAVRAEEMVVVRAFGGDILEVRPRRSGDEL
jgi:hypothetical protein